MMRKKTTTTQTTSVKTSAAKSPAKVKKVVAKKVSADTENQHIPTEAHVVTPEELLQDWEDICNFTIYGNPATKKNHQTAVWTKLGPRILPSKQYMTYEKLCKEPCEEAWKNQGKIPMDFGVAIEVIIYLKTWQVGDHVGYLQALGDIFEKHGILKNDRWISWVSTGRHWLGGKDKDNPRVDVIIKRYRHPYEIWKWPQNAHAQECGKENEL